MAAAPSIALPPLPLLRPVISRRSRTPTASSEPLLRPDIPRRPSIPPPTSTTGRLAAPRATPDDDSCYIPVRCSCGDYRCPGPSTPSTTTNQQQRPPPPAPDSREVAASLLLRSLDVAPARRGEGRSTLRCVCLELPPGSRCALHQDAPGQSWMKRQGGVPIVAGGKKIVVPKLHAGDGTLVVAEYMRWHRSVRLPSRFYMEHARQINAGRRKY